MNPDSDTWNSQSAGAGKAASGSEITNRAKGASRNNRKTTSVKSVSEYKIKLAAVREARTALNTISTSRYKVHTSSSDYDNAG